MKWGSLLGDLLCGPVDPRPTGLFRIAFSLLLMRLVSRYFALAEIFFSDTGVLPRPVMLTLPRPYHVSLLDYTGEAWQVEALLILWLVVLACLLLGVKPRLAAVLNYALIVSFHARNVFILNGADHAMRVMSFWLIFLPLDGAFIPGRHPTPARGYRVPLALAQAQVALIYLFAGLLKLPGGAWLDGSALAGAFRLGTFVLPAGVWLAAHTPGWLLQSAGILVTGFELAFPLLVFWPGRGGWPRALALTAGALLHLGITLTLAIPFFSTVMILAYLLFLRREWLDNLIQWLSLPQTRQDEYRTRPHHQQIISTMRATLLAAMMGLTIWHNASGTPLAGRMLAGPMPAVPRVILEASGLWQNWGLFAPHPTESYGWLLVLGRGTDGIEIDLRTGRPPAGYSPALYRAIDLRWRKYDERIAAAPERLAPTVRALADAACRGKLTPVQVDQSVEVWQVTMTPSPEGATPTEQHTRLTVRACGSS